MTEWFGVVITQAEPAGNDDATVPEADGGSSLRGASDLVAFDPCSHSEPSWPSCCSAPHRRRPADRPACTGFICATELISYHRVTREPAAKVLGIDAIGR